jgi:hypothetical protein
MIEIDCRDAFLNQTIIDVYRGMIICFVNLSLSLVFLRDLTMMLIDGIKKMILCFY